MTKAWMTMDMDIMVMHMAIDMEENTTEADMPVSIDNAPISMKFLNKRKKLLHVSETNAKWSVSRPQKRGLGTASKVQCLKKCKPLMFLSRPPINP